MSIEGLYADGIEAGIQRQLRNPGPAGPESFRVGSLLAAGMKALPHAAFDIAGGIRDFSHDLDVRSAQDENYKRKLLGQPPIDRYIGPGGQEQRAIGATFATPETAHWSDQMLHEVVRGGSKIGLAFAAAPAGVPGMLAAGAVTGVEATNTEYRHLTEDKGIDPDTALKVAGVKGAVTAASVAMPMAGSTLAKSAGLATLGGPGAFMAQEQAAKKILEKAGYHDEASLHNPLDPAGLTVASVFSFGVAGATHLPALRGKTPQLIDVVTHLESRGKRYGKDGELLTSDKGAEGEMQVMRATQADPGFGVKPADLSGTKEQRANEIARVGRDYLAAMEARYPGDPAKALAAYNAGPGRLDAAVAAHGENWREHMPAETRGYVAHGMNQLASEGYKHAAADPDVVDAARVRVTQDALHRSLPDAPEAHAALIQASEDIAAGRMPDAGEFANRDIEARFAKQLEDHESATAAYAALKDSQGGKVLNTDTARELSADYLKDRTRSAAVHEPASAFIKRLYTEKLAALQPEDRVLFTAGGTGAGKTSAIQGVPEVKAIADRAALIYDTNMNSLASAAQKVDQAIAAGAKVTIAHVQRDPVDALVNGAFPRAMRQEKEHGSGRTVPLNEHAKTHIGSARVIEQLVERYKDEPAVQFKFVDNTRGRDAARLSDLDFVRNYDYNGIEGKLSEAREQARQNGSISPAVYRGFAPAAEVSALEGGARVSREGVAGAGRGDGGQPEPGNREQVASKSAEDPRPYRERVERLAEETPDLKVTLPGSDQPLTLAVALERAREEHKFDKTETDLVKAALDCALGFGA